MLEAADQALVNDLTDAPSLKQRRALAKIITLFESTRLDYRYRADNVLNTLLPKTGKSFRLGISGVPSVGKSTLYILLKRATALLYWLLILHLACRGGSILGDKMRMEQLSILENTFIRPSSSVTEKIREAMLVAEAAGFDVIIDGGCRAEGNCRCRHDRICLCSYSYPMLVMIFRRLKKVSWRSRISL